MNRCWILALVLLLPGCRGFDLEPPADFVELEEPDWSSYALRATSADGVVIGVREVDDDRAGSLAFWKTAVKNRLRDARGYALLEEAEAKAATGEAGARLRFGRDEAGKSYVYSVDLFVTPGTVYVVEAGGEKAEWAKVQAAVEEALRGFAIR